MVASVLLAVAAVLVIIGVVVGSWPLLVAVAVLGVVLGVAATRITITELADSRRDAARERATLAKEYRAITDRQADSNAVFITFTNGRIARHEATIGHLEGRLEQAAAEAVEAARLLEVEQDRVLAAQDTRDRLEARLSDAESRAAEAIVRVAELEQELDVMLAEWHAAMPEPRRKHA
ncbi:hypothetical protein GCM10027020_25720 [Nocardioides salsibiostraticola]